MAERPAALAGLARKGTIAVGRDADVAGVAPEETFTVDVAALEHTAYFTGNQPPEVSVEGTGVERYPSPAALLEADWFPLVGRSRVRATPGTTSRYRGTAGSPTSTSSCIRTAESPGSGCTRDVVPDPRLLLGDCLDLAALENGGAVTGCSNMFYASPASLISPGEARSMGEGWETARRLDDGNDYVELELAGPGSIHTAELDTRYFVGNAPG